MIMNRDILRLVDTARNHPCRLASETLHPRHRALTAYWSIILTANTGYE